MVRIRQRQGRHFMDEEGRMFWINGPETFCYLSEQRQWRTGLSFHEVLEWKQCAPSGLVSQRFSSVRAACEAFEHNQVLWSHDLYLRRMGDQMALHRSADDYRPTAMKLAETSGLAIRPAPWSGRPSVPLSCPVPLLDASVSADSDPAVDLEHPRRRRRSLREPVH